MEPALAIPPTLEILTGEEVIALLRLDVGIADPQERLRNLTRRHQLPFINRGGVRVYRRSSLELWLTEREQGRKRSARRS